MSQNPTLSLDGYTDLPQGKLAAIVTFLEHDAPDDASNGMSTPDGLRLTRWETPDVNAYRALFKRIGTDWLWFSRLRLSDTALSHLLSAPTTEVYLPEGRDGPIGLLELDFADPDRVELSYFGLVPEAIGGGAGRWLMNQAIRLGFRAGARRMWVHTCTLDHPKALRFYLAAGFRPYKRAIEVFDDPRLTGDLPADAQAWNPAIG
ncbi:MAG: GNAT family N-acetyltransferase [Pseudomonadota bacterium]